MRPEIVLYCCVDYLINIHHGASTVTLARLLQEVNSPGKVLKLREEQLIRLLSDSALSRWVDLNESIGTIQVVLKSSLEAIRWQVLQHHYGCTEEQAKAIADGGEVPLYEPATLVERVHALKQARSVAKPASVESAQGSSKSDLLQRMQLSAALVEAGMRS